jgi:hypothetical protein
MMNVRRGLLTPLTAARLMLTSWQWFIGRLPALLLYGFLSASALIMWKAESNTWNIPRGEATSTLASHVINSSQDSSPAGKSQSPEALPSDNSNDNSSNESPNPNGQGDQAQPANPELLPPFEILGPLRLTFLSPGSILVLPNEPPPRSTRLLHV